MSHPLLMGLALWTAATAWAVPGREAAAPDASPSTGASSARSSVPRAIPPPLPPNTDSTQPIPDFKVELKGELLTESGNDSIFMTLASDSQRLSGSIHIGNQRPSRILEAKLTARTKPSWGPAVYGRFRLDFSIDACEHIAAEPFAVPYRWDPCFYRARDGRPVYPAWGEAWIDFSGIANTFRVTAAGTNDISNLSGVFRMTGVAKK